MTSTMFEACTCPDLPHVHGGKYHRPSCPYFQADVVTRAAEAAGMGAYTNYGVKNKPLTPKQDGWRMLPSNKGGKGGNAANEALNLSAIKQIPNGFKALEGISENALPLSKRPATQGSPEEWYYGESEQLYWHMRDMKLYVLDPVSRMLAEFRKPITADFKISVGACFHPSAVQSSHITIQDLTKLGQPFSSTSFAHLDKPCSLFALYEGHRGNQGNVCAEFCGTHVHQTILQRLAAFRGIWDDQRLQTMVSQTFQEVDTAFAAQHPSAVDGCCGVLALLLGQRLIVATLGDAACVICKRTGQNMIPFKAHSVKDPDDDEDDSDDGDDAPGDSAASASHIGMPYTRAFGDLDFKQAHSSPLLSATPDVLVTNLDKEVSGLALVCRALYKSVGGETAVSTVFKRSRGRPRMGSGAMVDAAVQFLGQINSDCGLGAIVAFFEHAEEVKDNDPKRRKINQPSQVRLRHILLKHTECKITVDKARKKEVVRNRSDAERILRKVVEECEANPQNCLSAFSDRCRELSECTTSQNVGDPAGDLGWVKPGKNEQKFGPLFDAIVSTLQSGQLSDLFDSEHGIHVFMRTA